MVKKIKKKIVHLSKFSPNDHGGIEYYVNNLSIYLSKFNIDHEILIFSKKNINIKNYKIIRKFFVIFNTPIFFNFFWFKDYIRKFDIIHLHLPNPIFLFYLSFIKLKDQKIIIHWHSDIIGYFFLKSLLRFFEKIVLKKSKYIICTTKSYAKTSLALKKFNSKIVIVPLFIFKNSLPIMKNKNKNKNFYNILSVGRLVKYKGYKNLIGAISLLPKKYVLNIIGDGPERNNLLNLIDTHNLKNRVKLMGNLDNKTKFNEYQKADLFVLSSISRKEAFGLVLIEAMYYNLPILTCYIEGSGVNEVNFSGLICYKNNQLELSKSIKKAINNLKKKKINYFKFYQKKYTEISQNKLISLYTDEK